MERVSGLDAAFLYFETPSMHMHVCGLLVLDTTTMKGGYSFERIRQLLIDRGPLMPNMRRKLATVPLGLGRPFWVEDSDFDIDYHVRRVGLPSPGGDEELAEICGDIASRPLDRSRPLWEMWVIEGLANGHVGIFAKMHHSTIDGVSGANMMVYLFDLEPDPKETPDVPDTWEPERRPRDLELLGRGVVDLVTRPLGIARITPGALVKIGGMLVHMGRRRGSAMAAPFTAPRTSFNATITPHRKIAWTEVSLADVKKVKEAFDCKVNDVVMALVSGALRRYLDDRNELPDKPLIGAIPVSVHDELAESAGNTKVSFMFSSLATDVADPVERLRTITAANVEAKELNKALGAGTLMQLAEQAATNTISLAMRTYSSLRLSERHPVVHNLIVSNVPGPPIPLYMAGGRLVALYPLGPIMDGAGLNVTVLSNEDRIGFGFIACRELMPKLWDLAYDVPDALAELVKEADR